ncbi:ATP-binding cassette subfamily B protein [Lacrimispora xylanisolvens]|jgi:ATP-binding cassette subfamily B protein|uniref:ATP-binding cassette subfamily B protein n=1 Tax=Lacrimispora xylanisolvens TaxID=384636 RepID=A0A2S6HYW9_9FIRM|nr:ABC transporter ATP-binding protein [Hungatella xylanolytica]MBE5988716.1 ABC transporter ATP-binding protein [Paenibacillaceae bacterium]PPK83342.1 ATP-binding cassette subfamily B protein [Hungatella xylanolytica]
MLSILKRLKKAEWLQVFASLIFIVAQVWLDLKLPDYMSEITRLTQVPGSEMADIWAAGAKMLVCALGSLVSAVAVGFFAARIAASFSQRLRSLLFSKVDSFSMEEINRFSTDSLITRSTNDITQVQMLITMGLQMLIKAPIMVVWAITKIAGKGYEWTVATGVAVGIMVVVIGTIMMFIMPKFKKMQSLTDSLNRVTRENLTGLRVVRAYNAENYQEEKFEQANQELTATQLYTNRGMAIMMPMMTTLMSGLSLAIYWIGANLINAAQAMDRLTIFSNMVVFSSYAVQVIMSFMMLVMIFILLPRASVSAKRINEVLETKPVIIDGDKKEGKMGAQGTIEFKNVSFQYPGAADCVLENISFQAGKGETVAFIGSTGSGKSTLISLIPRFYDATEGEILVDGVNVKDYTQEALHNKIGYVPQKAVMFRGTVSSNVAFGDNGKKKPLPEEIKSAVRTAQGSEFVENMEHQYEAEIAQGGTNVSGGQKQRLAIARAVCRKPEIYIFDDSFSALDYKTDRVLRSALKKESQGATSLIVAQRIGTIMDADQIIVLDEGKIVGKGTHRELLQTCSVYREIAMSQLSQEELIS